MKLYIFKSIHGVFENIGELHIHAEYAIRINFTPYDVLSLSKNSTVYYGGRWVQIYSHYIRAGVDIYSILPTITVDSKFMPMEREQYIKISDLEEMIKNSTYYNEYESLMML